MKGNLKLKEKRTMLERGFLYYSLSVLIISMQFMMYLLNGSHLDCMDIGGYLFFLTAAISHAALLALLPYLLFFLPIVLVSGKESVAGTFYVAGVTLLNVLVCLNGYVFSLYKFHINGMVISLLFGEGSDEIFQFDASLYFKAVAFISFFVLGNVFLKKGGNWLYAKMGTAYVSTTLVIFLLLTLCSNLCHAYAAVAQKQSVIKSATYLPYYFPLTANKLMIKMGVVSPSDLLNVDFEKSSDLNYPISPLQEDAKSEKKNIVVIVVDTWNFNAFTKDVMPNVTAFADRSEQYVDHLSSSNGTRGGIFGLFFGASSYYWKDFDVSGVCPVLIDQMIKDHYQIKTFPSATLNNPNFAKLIFYKVPSVKVNMEGDNSYERDCRLTDEFISFADTVKTDKAPFFSFLFYDLAHSGIMPDGKELKFTPSWLYPDYTLLDNDMDPTPYWNLYRNCMNQVDSLVGMVVETLEKRQLLDNTIVVITGDHGQEFNENHKNYWGHGSNYTYPQIHVPFIIHRPGCVVEKHTYRTTHYDVVPTLMKEAMGVSNDPKEYSMGRLLTDSTFRNWHVVGDYLNFAFVVEDNVIVEKKPSGSLEIYDAHLNPLDNYKIKSKELNRAISDLNKFYK